MWILVLSYCTIFYCDSYIVKRKFPTEEKCLEAIEDFKKKNDAAPPFTISYNAFECLTVDENGEVSPNKDKETNQ